MALSSFNPRSAASSACSSDADEVDIDGTGAFSFRRRCASTPLEHRVVLVGQGNKFELWDDAKWQEQTARAIASPTAACRRNSTASSL